MIIIFSFDQKMTESFISSSENTNRVPFLALRLCTLTVLVALLTIHIKSLRIFRWEQSVSGGVLVTYCVAMSGLALCTGTDRCGGVAFQVYICGVGAAIFTTNAIVLWTRWRKANQLTLVVADLLVALGVPLKRQIHTKVWLSIVAAIALFIDFALIPFFARQ